MSVINLVDYYECKDNESLSQNKTNNPFFSIFIFSLYFCIKEIKKIMKKALMLFAAMMMIVSATAQQSTKQNIVIKTKSGKVSGIEQEGALAFLGIPYAKVVRFMPPQPVQKWKGVRACDHWGPQAMQQVWGKTLSEDEMSENSCVLNVWTTDVKAHKPVMLWLHGGGFDSGTSACN